MGSEWAWHGIIDTLCKELNYKPDECYKVNYVSVLNWLSYFRSRDKVKQNIMKNNG